MDKPVLYSIATKTNKCLLQVTLVLRVVYFIINLLITTSSSRKYSKVIITHPQS